MKVMITGRDNDTNNSISKLTVLLDSNNIKYKLLQCDTISGVTFISIKRKYLHILIQVIGDHYSIF